jgi:hypothetical protein
MIPEGVLEVTAPALAERKEKAGIFRGRQCTGGGCAMEEQFGGVESLITYNGLAAVLTGGDTCNVQDVTNDESSFFTRVTSIE